MTTTLSEGVKVPDVGSVNWAGDLEVNWNLLNGALANLSGNVKLDRDNIWTGEQSFTLPIVGSITGTASKAIADEDGTNIKTGYGKLAGANTWTDTNTFSAVSYGEKLRFKNSGLDLSNGNPTLTSTYQHLIWWDDKNNTPYAKVQAWTNDTNSTILLSSYYRADANTVRYSSLRNQCGATSKSFFPDSNGDTDLGTSDRKWKSVYADSYYYGTTAWGLDQANVWSNINNFQREITLAGDRNAYVAPMWTGVGSGISFLTQDSSKGFYFGSYTNDANNRKVLDTAKGNLRIYAGESNSETMVAIEPINATNSQLGTSSNKWKTLNGINPGALSLPDVRNSVSIDIPTTWVTDGSAWNALNVSNIGDGWLCLTYRLCGANDYIIARLGGSNANIYPSMLFPATLLGDSRYYIYAFLPVTKAMGSVYFEIMLTSGSVLVNHSFFPAYGTV